MHTLNLAILKQINKKEPKKFRLLSTQLLTKTITV
jgi:hypothetical protein